MRPRYHGRVLRHQGVLLFVASTAAGLYFTSQALFNPFQRGLVRWQDALAVNMTYYYLWGLATPLIVRFARRVPFAWDRWPRWAAVHLPVSLAATAALILSAETLLKFVVGARPSVSIGTALAYALGANFHSSLPTYWFILLGVVVYTAHAQLHERELRAAHLETRLSDARLRALKMQLQPHFLFNTLNSVSSLMYESVERADEMLSRLGEFLRITIDGDARQMVSLSEELTFVHRYLEIERVRFDERLRVACDVDETLLPLPVPTLLLQPLVENAIHHAIGHRPEGGCIAIRAARNGDRLLISVADDGPGCPAGAEAARRVGLGGTAERLAELYGSRAALEHRNTPGGGFMVEVQLPITGEAAV